MLPHETAHTSLEPTIQILKVNSSYTHSWCTHCAWISFTVVQLNFIPASVHSETVYTTVLYNCTLARASLPSVLSTNHRRSPFYLLRSDWSISHPLPLANPDLNHSMLTTSFPYGNRHGKNGKPFVILPNRGWSVSNAKMV